MFLLAATIFSKQLCAAEPEIVRLLPIILKSPNTRADTPNRVRLCHRYCTSCDVCGRESAALGCARRCFALTGRFANRLVPLSRICLRFPSSDSTEPGPSAPSQLPQRKHYEIQKIDMHYGDDSFRHIYDSSS